MIYEQGPRGARTVPLSDFMRDMWVACFTDIDDWWAAGDVARLEELALAIPGWCRNSPHPSIAALVAEYLWAAVDTVDPKPQPEPLEIVTVEDVRKKWGGVGRQRLVRPTHMRGENWLYE